MAILNIMISWFLLLVSLARMSEGLNSNSYTVPHAAHDRHPRAAADNDDLISANFSCPLKISNTYLSPQKIWYTFLNSLYCRFSKHDIQVAKRSYNVANLEEWGKQIIAVEGGWKNVAHLREWLNGNEQGIQIDRSNFELFLNKTERYNIAEHDAIRNIEVTELQLKELNNVLSLTVKQRMYIYCQEPHIYIKGNYIIISKIYSYIVEGMVDNRCKGLLFTNRLKFLNIFALDTVFIDADINADILGMLEPMTVIAPKWEIIGSRKIEFNGNDGQQESYTLPSRFYFHGTDGKHGTSGAPGGNFFGIGEEFINGANLIISANGGHGSSGQDGGNGRDGKDGTTPSVPSGISCRDDYCDDNKQINLFRCQSLLCKYTISPVYHLRKVESCRYKLFGEYGVQGGNGGNGGKGGIGGNQGNIVLFELKDYSGISLSSNSGKNGTDGRGGKGGIGGKRGNDIIVTCSPYFFSGHWTLENTLHSHDRAESGNNGLDGPNYQDIVTPTKTGSVLNKLDMAKIINQYKSYVRENLNESFTFLHLTTFLSRLENDNNVKGLYKTLGLIDELQSLEEHFHHLNKDVNFLPFYKSLLNRISKYAENPTENVEKSLLIKVLGYLYTATLVKIYNLEDDLESDLIINIAAYLNSVKMDLEKIKDLQNGKNKEEVINKYKQEYKKQIDEKNREAIDLISKDITPELDKISADIDGQIETLINEISNLRQQSRVEYALLITKQQQLENKLVLQGLLSSFKILGGVVSFMGPVGQAAGAVITMGSTVAETFIFNIPGSLNNTVGFTTSISNLDALKGSITEIRERKVATLKNSLDSISQEANKHPDTFADISVKISDIRNRLDKVGNNKFSFQEVQNLEIELKATVSKQESTTAQEGTASEKKKNEFGAVENMKKAVQLSSAVLETYNKYKYHQAKLEAINAAVTKSEQKFHNLKKFEDKMFETVVPMLQIMQNDLDTIIRKLDEKSTVALDVTKWKVQSTLDDMMLEIQLLTQEFDVEGKLVRFIEKMKEGIFELINVYGHIQDYQKDQNFFNYIAHMNSIVVSRGHFIDDPRLEGDLRKALNDLDIVVKSSIVVQRHKIAVDAFKQFVFPFAEKYFTGLILPMHLKLDSNVNDATLDNLVDAAIVQIDKIISKLDEYKQTVKKYDACIGTGVFTSVYASSKPFYVWKNDQYKNMISELLSGKTIIVKANIEHSAPDKDAIKFNAMEFGFKSKSGRLQYEINNALQGFRITATHLGNSYYRYENKIYLMTTVSRNLWYNFEKTPNGDPVQKSISYDKVKNGDFMLSPYATWKIGLQKTRNDIDFEDLATYKDEIDLELRGYGYFFNKWDSNCLDLKVDDYYKPISTHNHSGDRFIRGKRETHED